jgi:hypothetical protein
MLALIVSGRGFFPCLVGQRSNFGNILCFLFHADQPGSEVLAVLQQLFQLTGYLGRGIGAPAGRTEQFTGGPDLAEIIVVRRPWVFVVVL